MVYGWRTLLSFVDFATSNFEFFLRFDTHSFASFPVHGTYGANICILELIGSGPDTALQVGLSPEANSLELNKPDRKSVV